MGGNRFSSGQVITGRPEAACGLVRVYGEDKVFLGVGELDKTGKLAPRRVFHAGEKNS
jgi:hypothetical protein